MTEATPSLREKFEDACVYRRKMWEQLHKAHEQGHTGTEQDFYKSFDDVANGLKAGIEALIKDIDTGRNLSTVYDALAAAPLKYEFVFPASMSEARQRYMEDEGLYNIPGYQKIHAICASKEIDMDVRVATSGGSYRTPTGEPVGYDSIEIVIDPTRPYKAKTNRSRPSNGNRGPA